MERDPGASKFLWRLCSRLTSLVAQHPMRKWNSKKRLSRTLHISKHSWFHQGFQPQIITGIKAAARQQQAQAQATSHRIDTAVETIEIAPHHLKAHAAEVRSRNTARRRSIGASAIDVQAAAAVVAEATAGVVAGAAVEAAAGVQFVAGKMVQRKKHWWRSMAEMTLCLDGWLRKVTVGR